ncbi:DUF885 family protein [Novosphingobium sp. ST904]|uniref:DUF885 domain-containing protein n=1 Tax=Novosphingobium sp. ST904 TaxID=1684385 RepID=UPI00105162BD|nr:DUF885 family protein [Novosphingobium sp. ST904]TCM37152.1 uncharacterized protein (DUF885 family) [Novosphingobium sp. ST904]
MLRREFMATAGAGLAWSLLSSRSAMAAATAPNGADTAFYAKLDGLFYESLAQSPEMATSLGLDKGKYAVLKSRLSDGSRKGREADLTLGHKAIAEVEKVDPAPLSETGRRNRELSLYQLRQRVAAQDRFDLESAQRPYLITQQGGAYFSLPDFLDSRHTIETKDDAEAYLSRLSAFRTALDDETDLQKEYGARGVVAPGWSLDLTLGQMAKLRDTPAAQSGLVTSLARRAAAKGIAGDWAARASAILEKEVHPALDRQIALLRAQRPNTAAGDGAWRLKRGDEIYAEALKQATTTEYSPEEVHRIGLEQVADLSAQLDTILRSAGLTQGPVGARLDALNKRPDQLYANTDAGRTELIAALNEGIRQMYAKLPQVFDNPPQQPLEIRRVPPEIQDGASNGYYYRAPLDGSRPAIYWINLKDVGDWPKYTLPSLTYHEGVPGHHLQGGYAQTGGELPMLLRNSFISAYGEGWALYAEQLADELGGYSGLERAGYLQSYLFRAARLVIDTGLHHYKWSREKAADYMVETVGFARPRSLREVERYCTMIGQACSYKMGHTAWVKARQRAQAALGDKFTLPWFHAVLAEGVMPLSMLDKRVDERIAELQKLG